MADGVDPSMDPMQPATHGAVLRAASAKAKRGELPQRDDAVLARRQRCDPRVQRRRWAGSATVAVVETAHRVDVGGHGPSLAGSV